MVPRGDGSWRRMRRVNGVKPMVTGKTRLWGWSTQCNMQVIENRMLETYMMFLTIVTPINVIHFLKI